MSIVSRTPANPSRRASASNRRWLASRALVCRRSATRKAARAAQGEAAFATGWAEGQALTIEAAVTLALERLA
jgi:hypothetical protein